MDTRQHETLAEAQSLVGTQETTTLLRLFYRELESVRLATKAGATKLTDKEVSRRLASLSTRAFDAILALLAESNRNYRNIVNANLRLEGKLADQENPARKYVEDLIGE